MSGTAEVPKRLDASRACNEFDSDGEEKKAGEEEKEAEEHREVVLTRVTLHAVG